MQFTQPHDYYLHRIDVQALSAISVLVIHKITELKLYLIVGEYDLSYVNGMY
ncbi:hypothetical protein ALE3EI_2529 [Constantimarinum furrinae]|uniref:Uncharacterized protein n=1 Tax=Constantimarinum furrinae TaxID=2562285 RepID=A0A7G8PXJ7_9FLAO|nr:hypothetical protein ALE3EI_2529 [Constantimarinum furrinae]